MKKFYAFAAAAFMAVSAFAQNGAPLYICGQADNLGWDPAQPAEFTFANGVYTFEATGVSMFKISTEMGDWDLFNAAAIGVSDYGDVPGVTKALEPWGENTMCPWLGDYTIEVAGDLSTLTLSTNSPEPPKQIFLRGDMNGWGSPAEWMMSNYEGDIYTFVCADGLSVKAGEGFKIADAGWAKVNYGVEVEGDEIAVDSSAILVYDGKNITLDEEWDGACWFNLATGAVLFSSDKEEPCPEEWLGAVKNINVENGQAVYFNLQGVRVANPTSGLYIVVKDGKAVKVVK